MMYHTDKTSAHVLFIASLLFIMSCPALTCGQEPIPRGTPPEQEEVLRIETDLVQTPVMVFDKQGRFVDNLKREQFELRIDGQPQQIAFFDRVTAGSLKEAEKYEAARKGTSLKKKPALLPNSYGRTLIFFVDDFHLSTESTQRVREALLKFINNSMGQEDSGVITTASGQLGFLQQLTDNKEVLRVAAERLKFRQPSALDSESPPMSPYQAIVIERGGEEDTLRYFADIAMQTQFKGMLLAIMNMPPAAQERMMNQLRQQAEMSVKQRARRILAQYSMINQMTYGALENLMRATIQLPGSKLVILISDGFHLAGQSNELTRLNSVTDAAVRSGAVIYSIQASGLTTSMPDAKSDVRYSSRLSSQLNTGRAPLGEDTSIQAPLYTLAVDTGGQPLFNSNSMGDGIKKAIRETSEYYLVAWKPQTSAQRQPGFRKIQVTVTGRPELTVRMQRGFLDNAGKPAADTSAKGTPPKDTKTVTTTTRQATTQDAMQEALSSTFPITDLPTSLSVSYMDFPKDGTKLISVTEVWSEVLFADNPTDKQPREIQVVGVVLNDEGKVSTSFNERLTANAAAPGQTTPQEQNVFQVARTQIKPGIYQVRVAARDVKSGRKGSSSQWIVVPDLSSKRLALSSLLVGEKPLEGASTTKTSADADQRARLSINNRFSRNSRLRFLTYIYNASRGPSGTAQPDLAVQMSIMRNNQKISTSPEMKVEMTGVEDMAHIPYAAQIKVGALPPGRYTLTVSVTDRNAKAAASRDISFWVE